MLKILYKIKKINKKKQYKNLEIKNIINDIIKYDDFALKYYIKKIDGIKINNINNLIINKIQMKKIYKKNNLLKKKILKEIYIRLKRFHFNYFNNSWQNNNNKIVCGQKITSIEKICIYVPGGKTIYPSSIYMNAIPALINNPKKIIMITPLKNGIISNIILSISYLCKINKIIFSGGVHTLTCLVYGTNTILKVNKIVGPGNYFITRSKKKFFGSIGIDMLAGPSELFILANKFIHPRIILFDFYSQLEHDENAIVYFSINNIKYINFFFKYIYKHLILQVNKKIIFKSLNNCYLFFLNIANSISLINYIAPEHLMLCTYLSNKLLKFIKNSGTIFLNIFSSESIGDYVAGPSHVIPTKKNSKFTSSLNTENFIKKINLIKTFRNEKLNLVSSYIAKKEKFFCHAYSSNIRI